MALNTCQKTVRTDIPVCPLPIATAIVSDEGDQIFQAIVRAVGQYRQECLSYTASSRL